MILPQWQSRTFGRSGSLELVARAGMQVQSQAMEIAGVNEQALPSALTAQYAMTRANACHGSIAPYALIQRPKVGQRRRNPEDRAYRVQSSPSDEHLT